MFSYGNRTLYTSISSSEKTGLASLDWSYTHKHRDNWTKTEVIDTDMGNENKENSVANYTKLSFKVNVHLRHLKSAIAS